MKKNRVIRPLTTLSQTKMKLKAHLHISVKIRFQFRPPSHYWPHGHAWSSCLGHDRVRSTKIFAADDASKMADIRTVKIDKEEEEPQGENGGQQTGHLVSISKKPTASCSSVNRITFDSNNEREAPSFLLISLGLVGQHWQRL